MGKVTNMYTVKIYDNETLDSDNPIIIEMKDFKKKEEAIEYASLMEKTKDLDYVYYTVTTKNQIVFDTQFD